MQILLNTIGILCEMDLTPAGLAGLIVSALTIIGIVLVIILLVIWLLSVIGYATLLPIEKLCNFWKGKSSGEKKDILASIWCIMIVIGFIWGCFNEDVLPVPIVMMMLGAVIMFVVDWIGD